MVRIPSYLQLSSHGIYYFRTVVPDALKSHLNRREIKCSLRTRFKQEAIGRALPLSFSIRHLFDCLEDPGMTYQEARALLQSHLDHQVAAIDRFLEKSGPLPSIRKRILEKSLRITRDAASSDRSNFIGRRAAKKVLERAGIPLVPNSDEYQRFCVEATKMSVARLEAFQAKATEYERQYGRYVPQETLKVEPRAGRGGAEVAASFSQGVCEADAVVSPPPHRTDTVPAPQAHHRRTTTSPQTDQADATTLTQALAIYTAEKIREGSWTEKTKETARSKHDLLVRIIGDIPIRQIGTAQVRDYKQVLQKLPSNINTKPLYRSKTISQILALNPDPGMSVLTVNNYLAWASTFFDWAERNGFVDRNPFRKMLLKNPKRAREARAAYALEDLQKLFSTPQYRDHRFRHPHYYWLPLLGLHSGARLNEVCQLHLKDIRQEDGVWVLDINEFEPDKRVKTQSARRLVPIHPKLIELGLLRYVEEMRQKGETRLFPELKPMRDGAGQAASKWFARYRKPLGLYKHTPKKDFHSFRTTLINELKQKGHPEAQVAAVVGHATEGLTFGTYGKAYRPSVLITVLADADFSSGLGNVRAWVSE